MKLKRNYKVVIIIGLFFLLVLIRGFAPKLFYDPFIEYFKNDYLQKPIPVFSGWKLLVDLIFRYSLNTLISLLIIYVAFQKRNFNIFALKFYILSFVVLIITFFVILKGELQNGYLFAFYIRRFLIHPLFVILLLPAFYYKQLSMNRLKL